MTNLSILNLKVVKERDVVYAWNKKIDSPDKILKIAIDVLKMHEQAEESFCILTLDTKNKVNGIFEVSRGTLNASIVHPREVFKRALMQNANSIVLLHNHPSGDPEPSKEDLNVTQRLIETGEILGIGIVDHIIVGDDRYTSFKEKGLM